MGPVLGPHARIDRTRDTRVAEPWLPAPEDGRPGEGQRLTPGAPHNGGRHPPGDALPPPPQRATPARKGARWGAGAGYTRPYRPHPGHTGRGTLAARSRGRAAGGGTAPDTRRPSQRWKAPPPGDALPPPPQRATPAREGSRFGAGAEIPRPHRPHPGHAGRGTLAARSRGRAARGRRPRNPKPRRGEPGPDRPPPKHARRSTGPGQDTRRGTDQVERPYQRPVPGPREMRAPHHPAGGGADTARARAHTHEKDTRGLPEGQPDRARGTHRPHGMAYQRARVRDTRRGRPATRSAEHAGREGGNRRDTTPGTGPNPPRTGRERRAHTDGTLHPPRQ